MMPNPQSPAVAVATVEVCNDPFELLGRLPGDSRAAAADAADAAAAALERPVSVCWRIGECWSVVAGDGPSAVPGSADLWARQHRRAAAMAGDVVLVWDPAVSVSPELCERLQQLCVWLSLALERDQAVDGAAQATDESSAVRDVVERLLSVRDVDQVLLSIANHTLRLLEADICGVMLREDDEVRMRSCVGNRVIETSRLHMRRGQGVAGLVFLTGQPAKVDDYLRDETISQDFMSLAVQEETRSALAVPLRLHGEFLGVLEVWRRRRSLFTERDVRRLVTLADFATIAIDNARLHDEQACAVRKTKQARDALEHQVAVLARSSSLQQSLLTTVVDGGGLTAIARTVAVELDCQIGIYGPKGELSAAHGGRRMVADVPVTLPPRTGTGRTSITTPVQGKATAWVQPVFADGDQVGRVVLIQGAQSAEMMDVVAGQVAMACSLTLLRQRAASRARAEALDQVLWDLLQGSLEHRIAARGRAQQLDVAFAGSLRVLHGQLENLEDLATGNGWDTSQTDRVRRDVLRSLRRVDDGRALALVGLRGDLIVAVAGDVDSTACKDLVNGLTATVRAQLPELRLTWGVSRSHDDPVDLSSASNEARTALSAAHRLGGENVFLYEELGIVRLLLGSGDDPDLQTFIDDLTGPLIDYDRNNDGSLIRTLRGFFDADCSQRVAAERLFIHHKTLRYRLERIRQLTGLDLSRHEDRMRADFALRLLQINGGADTEEPHGAEQPRVRSE